MKPLIPYLFFNGNCREAMNFYQQCFGGELEIMTYGDAPQQNNHPAGPENEIIHSFLKNDHFTLMASDWPNQGAKLGDNVQLNISCESLAEIEELFKKLTNGGKIIQSLSDTFWGARFGMLIDQFGIHWMLNYPLK